MTREPLKPQREIVVKTLRERSEVILSFIETAHDFPSGERFRSGVQDAAAKGDLRTLRLLAREIDKIILSLPPHEREGLEAILRDRFGVDADAERERLKARIAVIIERGTIASEKERSHLEEYVEMLEATEGDPNELDAVLRLLGSTDG
jgi:hypothetical protein